MESISDISLMGCGWLGLPLAELLVSKGYSINGSTTNTAKLQLLNEKGIKPYLLNLQDESINKAALADFLNSRILVLNIPPRLRSDGGTSYLAQLHRLLKAMTDSPVSRVLFVSSTSVYPDLNRAVIEDDDTFTKINAPQYGLLQAENLFRDREDWLTTVVRFAGLVGADRQPGRFLAGKKQVPNGDAPVNLIHLDDCIAILYRIIEEEKWGKVYNACSDEHPLRKAFYPKAALALGLAPPEFEDMTETKFKLIKSQKLKDDLSYTFLHPNPMTFF